MENKKDTFFTQTQCDRCGASLDEGRTMSVYNKDCICIACETKEKGYSDYEVAAAAERNAVVRGDYNFPGIGLPEERQCKDLQVIQHESPDGNVLLIRESGETITLKWNEFWAICRAGTAIDTKDEVEEYLRQCEKIGGVVINNETITPDIIEAVSQETIGARIARESGDDIYDATLSVFRNIEASNKK